MREITPAVYPTLIPCNNSIS